MKEFRKNSIIKGFKDCLIWVNEWNNSEGFTSDSLKVIDNLVSDFIHYSKLNDLNVPCFLSDVNLDCSIYEYIGHDLLLTIYGYGVTFGDRRGINYLNDVDLLFMSVVNKMSLHSNYYQCDFFISSIGFIDVGHVL